MNFESNTIPEEDNNNHGWQKVTYAKKKKKNHHNNNNNSNNNQVIQSISNGSVITGNDNVFTEIEKKSEERRKVIEAQRLAIHDSEFDVDVDVRSVRKKNYSGYEDSDEDVDESKLDADHDVVEKKKKVKKVKKPKVTVAEAAVKIDVDELAGFLLDVSVSELCRFCYTILWFAMLWFCLLSAKCCWIFENL